MALQVKSALKGHIAAGRGIPGVKRPEISIFGVNGNKEAFHAFFGFGDFLPGAGEPLRFWEKMVIA